MKIFINPGHGGDDCGAVGNGLKERDVVLRIGKRVENYLRAVGYDVKLFQYDGLQAICDDANSWYADYFISIHCNAVDNPQAHGTETFFASPAGEKLALAIQNQIVKTLGTFHRKVERRNHYVTLHTDMPAVLVETAFLSNTDDAKLLREREDDFARAIARGISDFFAANVPTPKPLPDVIDFSKHAHDSLSEHFAASEFLCHCCGQGNIDSRLIELLEELRAKAGAPIHINCGYRCPKHNAEVGGVPNSQHVEGTAADIFIPAIGFDKAAELVKSLPFDGTGFYPPISTNGAWFIHVDVRNGGIGSHIEWWE